MTSIPFSVYDFFGYLASGFLFLAAVDYASDGGWLLTENLGIVFAILWTVAAYIVGHLIANISGYFLERIMIRRVLLSPEITLFREKNTSKWAWIFPGFYEPLPKEIQDRILAKAKKRADIESPGRALFLHSHAVVKRDETTQARLNSFLNLYGFCRNISMAALFAFFILLAGILLDHLSGREIWWSVAALAVAIGMFYRYLKFFRHYTTEVFVSYPEID
jgi:hypothetical protein